jgi:hypothetical protein
VRLEKAEIIQFVAGSQAGLAQLLVAAADQNTFKRIVACPTYPVPTPSRELSKTIALFKKVVGSSVVHVPTFLAELFESAHPLRIRKLRGQFFTSQQVADWSLEEVGLEGGEFVCDAGAGAGVFAQAVYDASSGSVGYVGVENDPLLALSVAHTLQSINAPETYKVWYTNFLLLNSDEFAKNGFPVPTTIISNPPFIRSHKLLGREKIAASIKTESGIEIPPFAGSSSYFLAKAANLLNNQPAILRPRILFFQPIEASGSAHSKRLRNDLKKLFGWSWHEHPLDNSGTGINRHPSNAAALFYEFEHKIGSVSDSVHLGPTAKLSDLLNIKRGTSTGKNRFFVLTDKEITDRHLSLYNLRPILPTKISIKEAEFTADMWNDFRISGNPCWLLTLPPEPMESFDLPTQDYLREGVRLGVHLTPTAKLLRFWYSISVPPSPPDVFVKYMFRGAPRFILNSAKLYNLTNILGGRFCSSIDEIGQRIEIVTALNEQAIRWAERSEPPGREYRGGLRKIEPRELSKLELDSKAFAKLFHWVKPRLINPSLF